MSKYLFKASLYFALTGLFAAFQLARAQDAQRWEILLLDQNQQVHATASMQCIAGGACDASAWTILTEAQMGCLYQLDFSVQFSGSSVRLLLFHESLDSNCSNMRLLVATGSGTADAAYPDANNASGEVTLGFEAGGQNSTGTTNWRARRLPD